MNYICNVYIEQILREAHLGKHVKMGLIDTPSVFLFVVDRIYNK
jgi:hypothetical protein